MIDEITQLKNEISELKNIITDMSGKTNDLHAAFTGQRLQPENTFTERQNKMIKLKEKRIEAQRRDEIVRAEKSLKRIAILTRPKKKRT